MKGCVLQAKKKTHAKGKELEAECYCLQLVPATICHVCALQGWSRSGVRSPGGGQVKEMLGSHGRKLIPQKLRSC